MVFLPLIERLIRRAPDQRPSYVLELGGHRIQVQPKPIRNLRLRLGPDGQPRVSAPLRASRQWVGEFVLSQLDWIRRHQDELALEAAKPRLNYISGDRLRVLGRVWTLRLEEVGRIAKVVAMGEELRLRVPVGSPRERRKAALERWMAGELLRGAEAMLPSLVQAMGTPHPRLKIRAMRTRWGSCDARGERVTLALELARQEPASLEYILVHELAHFKFHSHGPRFKAVLDRHLPDWRERRKLLKYLPS